MSRIGKLPVNIPSGIEVIIANNIVNVKSPKGQLSQYIDPAISVKVDGSKIIFERHTDQKRHRAMHGLYRALVANMIQGLVKPYKIEQELVGVGYRASNQGQLLDLVLGYSHHVLFEIPTEIKLATKTEKGSNPTIIMESADKQLLGQVAAKIRSLRHPEPYKGKGIKFSGEILRRKAGKAAAKASA